MKLKHATHIGLLFVPEMPDITTQAKHICFVSRYLGTAKKIVSAKYLDQRQPWDNHVLDVLIATGTEPTIINIFS